MKTNMILLLLAFLCSYITPSQKGITKLSIEVDEINEVISLDNSNFEYKAITDKLKVGANGISLIYRDTITSFDEVNYTEEFKVIKREIPIKIIEVK